MTYGKGYGLVVIMQVCIIINPINAPLNLPMPGMDALN